MKHCFKIYIQYKCVFSGRVIPLIDSFTKSWKNISNNNRNVMLLHPETQWNRAVLCTGALDYSCNARKAGEERVRVKYLSFQTVEEDSHSCRATEVIHKALSAWAERQRSWCAALIVTLRRSPRHTGGVNTSVLCSGDTSDWRGEK